MVFENCFYLFNTTLASCMVRYNVVIYVLVLGSNRDNFSSSYTWNYLVVCMQELCQGRAL